jgi:hypothetical protein
MDAMTLELKKRIRTLVTKHLPAVVASGVLFAACGATPSPMAPDATAPSSSASSFSAPSSSVPSASSPMVFVASAYEYSNKITICHRTDDVKKPYVVITVEEKSLYGESVDDDSTDDDRGDGKDESSAKKHGHYGHQGPIFDPAVNTSHKIPWGDIIPPVPGVPAGLNWGASWAQGVAIFNNGCNWMAIYD